jgi:hypothetical protein
MLKANGIFSIYRLWNAHIVRAILVAVRVLAAAALLAANSRGVAAAQHKPTQKALVDGPQPDMIRALSATSPHPSLGDQTRVFDRFVGTWDFDCVLYSADGTIVRFPGEWIFGWVLDGRALQDVWIGYQKSRSPGERGIGTTLRFYDAKAAQWHIIFVVPGPPAEKPPPVRKDRGRSHRPHGK